MEFNLMRFLTEKQEAHEKFALVTVISSDDMEYCSTGEMMIVDQNGNVIGGGIGGGPLQEKARQESKRCIDTGLSRKAIFAGEDGTIEVFINASTIISPHNRDKITVDEIRRENKKYMAIEECEQIQKLLIKNGGNVTKVAHEIGISRNTLYKKLHKYNIKLNSENITGVTQL